MYVSLHYIGIIKHSSPFFEGLCNYIASSTSNAWHSSSESYQIEQLQCYTIYLIIGHILGDLANIIGIFNSFFPIMMTGKQALVL